MSCKECKNCKKNEKPIVETGSSWEEIREKNIIMRKVEDASKSSREQWNSITKGKC